MRSAHYGVDGLPRVGGVRADGPRLGFDPGRLGGGLLLEVWEVPSMLPYRGRGKALRRGALPAVLIHVHRCDERQSRNR